MDAAAKTQIVERIKQANNILVTVSTNPTVDQLAACIGATLLLNRMGKHATAVFSGQVPSTLEFLQPEKTIEANTDSLRDFIISLDKNKADKLRYKVEDQVVRIYITPYKTSISEKDLVFAQGDFNVEVVLALGIQNRTQVDAAIAAHGKILHDATVISLAAGQGKAPDLGQINWQDTSASSLCEMLVSVSEAFGTGLIDNQMATAFLTGIVAETKRFSNSRTSPRVMTMSAQLMAAGANQQLIVSKLEPPVPTVQKYDPTKAVAAKPPAAPKDGTLTIQHEEKPAATLVPTPATNQPATPIKPDEIHIDAQGNLVTAADLAPPPPQPDDVAMPVSELPVPAAETINSAPPASTKSEDKPPGPHALLNPEVQSPMMSSTFTANAEPEWADPYNNVTIDPLGATDDKAGILEHKTINPSGKSSPPSVDNVRSAVQNALEAAPADSPAQSLNASPMQQNPSSGPQTSEAKEPSSAPPFPPPLAPVQGVVIPAQTTPASSDGNG